VSTERQNFLLAFSAAIPLLVITLLVELRALSPTGDAKKRRLGTESWLGARVAQIFVTVALLLIAWEAARGEWVALRSLELGHMVGSAHTLWTTVLVLGVLIVGSLVMDIWFMQVPPRRKGRKPAGDGRPPA